MVIKKMVYIPYGLHAPENRHARRGYPKAYKHMVKLIFNPCETLGL